MTSIGNNPALSAYYQAVIKKGGSEDLNEPIVTTVAGDSSIPENSVHSEGYSFEGEDIIAANNRQILVYSSEEVGNNGNGDDWSEEVSYSTVEEDLKSYFKNNSSISEEDFSDVKNLILNNVDGSNISIFAAYYAGNAENVNLIESIANCDTFSEDEKKELIAHIKDCYVERYSQLGVYTNDIDETITNWLNDGFKNSEWENIDNQIHTLTTRMLNQDSANVSDANGEIDGAFKQLESSGDCWFISALNSILQIPETAELINDMLTVDKDGNIIVDLKHVGKTYTITQEELKGANELSVGDLDVRALEIAVNRYLHEVDNVDINDGNDLSYAAEILLGVSVSDKASIRVYDGVKSDDFYNDLDKSITIAGADYGVLAVDENGNEVMLGENHAYSVMAADENYVYLEDPTQVGVRYKVSKDDFESAFTNISKYSLEQILEAERKYNEMKAPLAETAPDLSEELPEEATKLSSNAADDAKLRAGLEWTYSTFSDADGNFDSQGFTNWVNSHYPGSAYNYTGNDAAEAFNALKAAADSGNWTDFWENVGNYNSNTNNNYEGYNYFDGNGSSGGGYGGGGGSVYDKYGNIDWKNAGLSLMDARETSKGSRPDGPVTLEECCDEA